MSKVDTKVPGDATKDGEGEFIQVRKKSERITSTGGGDKHSGTDRRKNNKSRSRNNSIGEGKPSKARYRVRCLLIPGFVKLSTIYLKIASIIR